MLDVQLVEMNPFQAPRIIPIGAPQQIEKQKECSGRSLIRFS
jgi:hypothetical protein